MKKVDIDVSRYTMTEEELKKLQEFKENGNKYLEKDGKEILSTIWSEPFSGMVQAFNFITEKINFSKPFRIIIDYDPEQKKTVIHQYEPKHFKDTIKSEL